MPISKERMKLYPGGSIHSKEWKTIRSGILSRAGNCCEGTPQFPDCRAENKALHPQTGSKVVLTIAHMDNRLVDHSDSNLRALCQRCHLAWDHREHIANATITRYRKRGQPDLFVCTAA